MAVAAPSPNSSSEDMVKQHAVNGPQLWSRRRWLPDWTRSIQWSVL